MSFFPTFSPLLRLEPWQRSHQLGVLLLAACLSTGCHELQRISSCQRIAASIAELSTLFSESQHSRSTSEPSTTRKKGAAQPNEMPTAAKARRTKDEKKSRRAGKISPRLKPEEISDENLEKLARDVDTLRAELAHLDLAHASVRKYRDQLGKDLLLFSTHLKDAAKARKGGHRKDWSRTRRSMLTVKGRLESNLKKLQRRCDTRDHGA
ncbi:MAG: hypothetical protein MK135_09715 [Polyangiaceae bacterium]|nr:hypothetical protein [Polyangiaceae bacterium]